MSRMGLRAAGSVQARHQVALAVVRAEHLHVARGKAGVEQALGHGFGRDGGAAHRIGGVDFDELLENVVGKLLYVACSLRAERDCGGGSRGQKTCQNNCRKM